MRLVIQLNNRLTQKTCELMLWDQLLKVSNLVLAQHVAAGDLAKAFRTNVGVRF